MAHQDVDEFPGMHPVGEEPERPKRRSTFSSDWYLTAALALLAGSAYGIVATGKCLPLCSCSVSGLVSRSRPIGLRKQN
jgi:hypothetical protein